MRFLIFASLASLASFTSLAGGCDGAGGGTSDVDAVVAELPPYRAPVLSAVNPPTVSAGSPGFVLAADGVFDADAVVLLDGAPLTTRVVSPTAVEADVPASAIEAPGRRAIRIVHTGDGGGLSATRHVVVVAGVAGPVLAELVPDRLIVGNPAATIVVDGWNFTGASVVIWNGSARPTTFVASHRLEAALPATDFAAVGTATVTVVTPDAAPAEAPLVFTIEEVPVSPIGVSGLVSVTTAGVAGGGLGPVLSLDGRHVAFQSTAPDLIAGDTNNVSDIFVRDTCRGAGACTPSTVRVSLGSTGAQLAGASTWAAISATGRYVAFVSFAANVVPGAGPGVFVRDTCLGVASGCTPTTIQASISEDGMTTDYRSFYRLDLSRDGRFVGFEANIGPMFRQRVFYADTCLGVASGCTPRTEMISRTLDGTTESTTAELPAVSADGRYVAFRASGVSLDGQPVTPSRPHVWVLDTCHGASGCTRTMTRATVALDGSEAQGFPVNVDLSGDGRYVGFSSYGATWTAETNPGDYIQVFVRDTCIGATACTPATTDITSVGSTASNGNAYGPIFSADGRFVAFMSRANDLVVNDTNARHDVFVHDRCLGAAGCTPSVRRVSVTDAGVEGNGDSGVDQPTPAISGDGSITAWSSRANNLVTTDANAIPDVFTAGTGYPE